MQAMGEDPDLLEHALKVTGYLVKPHLDLARQREPRLHGTEAEGQGDDPLLDPVMEIALDPAPCLVAGGDDPGARRDQVVAGMDIGDRAGDEVREVGEPRSRII